MKLLLENFNNVSDGLRWHLDYSTPLCDNIYRVGSTSYFSLIREARALYVCGALYTSDPTDLWILNSDIGEFGLYEGKKVVLDFPLPDDDADLRLLMAKLTNKALKQFPSSIKQKNTIKQLNAIRVKLGMNPIPLTESTYNGRDVELNTPSRSTGPKKYKVYVKNEKGNVVQVNFGDVKGGLKSKIDDPAARKAFADRHDCKNKKDKTTPGYWSCNLPKYQKYLGMGKNMNVYW